MKPITRIKRMIEKQLNSKETIEISQYARELYFKKRKQEQVDSVRSLGVGSQVLIQGGSSEMARLGIGAKIGIIKSYGPKRVKVLIQNCERPGEWRIPYHYLYPPTEKNIKRERKLLKHAKMTLPMIKNFNKVAKEVLG